MNSPADKYKNQILSIIFSLTSNPTLESSLKKTQEALEESNIPYKIDLINLNLSKEEFKRDGN